MVAMCLRAMAIHHQMTMRVETRIRTKIKTKIRTKTRIHKGLAGDTNTGRCLGHAYAVPNSPLILSVSALS